MKNSINPVISFVGNILSERIDHFSNEEILSNDLCSVLLEEHKSENRFFKTRDEAIRWIQDNFDSICLLDKSILERVVNINPVLNPESFVLSLILEVAEYIVLSSPYMDSQRLTKIKLDIPTSMLLKYDFQAS